VEDTPATLEATKDIEKASSRGENSDSEHNLTSEVSTTAENAPVAEVNTNLDEDIISEVSAKLPGYNGGEK
jgi:hypothetical protein